MGRESKRGRERRMHDTPLAGRHRATAARAFNVAARLLAQDPVTLDDSLAEAWQKRALLFRGKLRHRLEVPTPSLMAKLQGHSHL